MNCKNCNSPTTEAYCSTECYIAYGKRIRLVRELDDKEDTSPSFEVEH